jgi:predicted anti-sigma-YlaC factor YlaD
MNPADGTPLTRRFPIQRAPVCLALLSILASSAGCSLRTYAINTVGDALATGNSVYETDDDIELVGTALPFGLKLTESLLAQSPNHAGLLLTACRGFTMYSYAYVGHQAEILNDEDLDRARAMRQRARRLYLRGARYGFRALERNYAGLERALTTDPTAALAQIDPRHRTRDVPLLYWTAAALGLAVSASLDDAALLARLPEVEALLDRALALDEAWNRGALHEFKMIVAGSQARSGAARAAIERHYARALELSEGTSAGLFVAYAEAVSLPAQNRTEFKTMLERALAIDPDRQPSERLTTLVSQRRARWLLGRIDDLFLTDDQASHLGGVR